MVKVVTVEGLVPKLILIKIYMKVFTVQDLAVRENLEIKVNWEETLRPLQKEIGVGFGTLKNLSNNKTRNTLNQKPRTRRNLVTWLQEKGYKIHLQV